MPESRDLNRLRNLLRICCHLRRPEHFAADSALVICLCPWLCTGNKRFIHLYDIVILDRGCRFKQLVIAFINVYCIPLCLRPAEQHSIQLITCIESIYIDHFYTAGQHNSGQIITFIKTTIRNLCHTFWNYDFSQAFTRGKSNISYRIYCSRNRNCLQAAAARKRSSSNRFESFRQLYCFQIIAFPKGIFFYTCDIFGQHNALKLFASTKCIFIYPDYRVRDRHFCDSCICKCILRNRRNTIRHYRIFSAQQQCIAFEIDQCLTVPAAVKYRISICYRNFFQPAAIIKRMITNRFAVFGNRNLFQTGTAQKSSFF